MTERLDASLSTKEENLSDSDFDSSDDRARASNSAKTADSSMAVFPVKAAISDESLHMALGSVKMTIS